MPELSRYFAEPWAICDVETLAEIARTRFELSDLSNFAMARGVDLRGRHLTIYSPEEPPKAPVDLFERYGSIAVIDVQGTILKRPDKYDRYYGCCDIDEVRALAEIATLDASISHVVLRIDSPGGMACGTPEAGEAIGRLSDAKPVYAFTETGMASAAYWLGCQASAIYGTPTSRMGSIGVYALFTDASGMLEKWGVKVNAISSGKWKLAGAPFKAMTDEERARFQTSVDKTAKNFRDVVASARGPELKRESMEGQMFDCEDAIAAGLCDGIVSSFDELLTLIAGNSQIAPSR